jgi:hypothetical protein
MKVRTEELHALHILPHFIRMRISFMSHVACMGDLGKAYKVLVGRSEGKRPPGPTWCRYEDKIKMKLNHIGWRLWIGLSCLRIRTSVISVCHQQ